jgi:nucleotide-binding universal stress UspA family protein
MDRLSQPTIMVGVRNSVAAAGALHWAAAEAWRRGARLLIIWAWDPQFDAPYAAGAPRCPVGQQQAAAQASLDRIVRAEFGPEPPGWVTAELWRGVPERVLVPLSADADLLVLGSAAPDGPQACSIGPVIRGCLGRSQCPVVVTGGCQPASHPYPAGDPLTTATG